jgi:hypothetical protein
MGWERACARRSDFETSAALPRFAAAIAVHGLCNFGALLFSIANR